MADIFTPWRMGSLEMPNRLVRSATWEGMAEPDGTPTLDTVNFTAAPAEGGAGLVITGYAFVNARGRGLPKQTGAHINAMVGPLTRISDAVHKCGGLTALQIVHAGGQTKEEWIGRRPVGPTAMVHPAFGEQVEELSLMHIEDIIDDFAMAAARGKAAGFDAVELHGAHGYLISQFLSAHTNQRDDDYGGNPENRARFCMQVFQAARDAVGPDYPLFIKLNTEDGLGVDGLQIEEAVLAAAELSLLGIDAIEVSGGVPAAGKNSPSRVVKDEEDEGYFLANARRVKEAVDCPVIVVGGFRGRGRVEEALDSVDAAAMSRPFIRQPNLANLWMDGSRDKAACISCGQCFAVGMKQGVACGQELKKQRGRA